MSLLKQPWFLIFLILVGIYSYSSLSESPSLSISVNAAEAGGKKTLKKGKIRRVEQTKKISPSSAIDTLKIDGFESMNVTLEPSSQAELTLDLKGKGRRYINRGESFSDWLQTRVSNGILRVSPAVKETNIKFVELFKGSEELHLTIKYPQQQKFDEIEVLTISGNIEMEGTFAKDIRLKSVSGDIDFKKVNCKNLTVEAVSSDLDLSSIFAAHVIIKTVSGDATISSSTELPRYTFKSVSGDLDLKLPKTAQIDVDFKSMTGELVNHFTKKSQTSGSVEVSSMSGDAEISKIQ